MEFRYQIIVGVPMVREKSRKNEKNQGQGKVKSWKFDILAKVGEKLGNFRNRSRGWRNRVIREINEKITKWLRQFL